MVKNNYQLQIESMGKEQVKQPHYSKRGFLIEYTKFNKQYLISLIIRVLYFAFDFIVPSIIQYLAWQIFKMSIIMSGIVTVIYFHMYYFMTMLILHGRTLGMAIAKKRVVHKSGFGTTMLNYYIRSMVSATLALPFIGWGLMVLNGFSLLLLKGISLVDLVSQTIIVSQKQYDELKLIERLEQND